jgi:hypothetical protein
MHEVTAGREIVIRDARHAIALERAMLTSFSDKTLCCTNNERVGRSSFSDRLQRISAPRPLSLLPTRIWSDEEWERIQLGYCSRDMDEKWDVFAEGTSSSCTELDGQWVRRGHLWFRR